MSPRIAVELTSERADGSWTWRAAGARQPKGVLDGKLLPPGAGVGDVLRVEAEIGMDGITVTTVLPPKGERREPERLEVVGSGRDEPGVTTSGGAGGRGGGQGGRTSERRPRRPEGETSPARARGPARPGDRSTPARGPGDHGPRERHPERRVRPPRLERPARPKPKKLRPGRSHRDSLVAALPPEQQPIAEQALRGGMPAVRTALDEQRASARAEGKPEAPAAAVLAIAEGLLPRLRVADWLDRAEAALADVEELALADLRSVVVSADDVARDQQTREPAARLRAVLERRTEAEQLTWRQDLEQSLAAGRVVRALRLSSRAPDPGARLAPETATALAESAGGAMSADIAPDRWAILLDAVAYSAVRRAVVPAGAPAEPGDELLAQVRKHAGRVPAIAALFGIEAPVPKQSSRTRRSGGRARGGRAPAAPASEETAGAARPRPRRIPPPPDVSAQPDIPAPPEGASEAAASDTPSTPPPATVGPPQPEPAATVPVSPPAVAKEQEPSEEQPGSEQPGNEQPRNEQPRNEQP